MRATIAGLAIAAFVMGCTNQLDVPAERIVATPDTESNNSASGTGTSAETAPAEPFGVGDAAPAFEGLAGTDGKPHSLNDFADAKAVVVAFICNHCPVAVAYEDRLIAFQKDYADKGVQLVAINVNNLEEDKLPAMKQRAEQKGFNFPYLYDPTQTMGHAYGAAVTPHIFVLDGQRRLAYVGPVDDSQDETQVTQQYLRDAVDAVLAGNTPQTTETKPFGCSIKYE
jgi:peroxiredoxin